MNLVFKSSLLFACLLGAEASFPGKIRRAESANVDSIVGGTVMPKGSRPYLVATGSFYSFNCGGSLITPNVVLTAAHCQFYYDRDEDILYWDPTHWVEFNEYNRNPFGFHDPDVIRMYLDGSDEENGAVVVHPQYNRTSHENDIALLFLPRAIEGITPVKLNSDPNIPLDEAPLDVAGWGQTDLPDGNLTSTDVPYNTTVEYIPNEFCVEPYTKWPEDWITSDMLCAAYPDTSPCYGDSGGPLVVGSPDGGPEGDPVVQVGVVNWGYGCFGGTEYPGVYSRVSANYDWIVETVCERTGELCPPSPPSSKSAKTSPKSGKSDNATNRRGPPLNRCVFANPTLVLSDILDEFALEKLIGYNDIFSDAVEEWVDEDASPEYISMMGKLSEEYLTTDEICLFAFGLVVQMEDTCLNEDYVLAYVNTAANIMHGVSRNGVNTPVDILECSVLGKSFEEVYGKYLTKESKEFLS